MHERIRDRLLGSWGRLVASHPLITLSICLPLAAAAVLLTARNLKFLADRSDLVDPGRSWNVAYHEYKEAFPRASEDVVVVLDGTGAPPVAADDVARAIAARLRADPRVDAADAGFDASQASPRFFRLAPREDFDRALTELAGARQIAAAPNANAAMTSMLGGLNEASGNQGGAESLGRLDEVLAPYIAAASGLEPDFSFLDPRRPRFEALASKEGDGPLRYVLVHFSAHEKNGKGVDRLSADLKWLRASVADVVAASSMPRMPWGVTGIPAIEADETSGAIHDATMASFLALALIAGVMVIAFRGLYVPLLACAALLVGMAWSFGWLVLSVGHLQLLSVVFASILMGLGIDYALLYVSRLELIQDEHRSLASATSRVYRGVGPGMVTGAATTAAAFAAIALTDFRGMAEMGIIASGGIILCMIAVLCVLPALLALTGKWKRIIRHRPGGETAHFANGRLDFADDHPVATLIVAGLIVAATGALAVRVRYDPNVLNLQSRGVESVEWEHRIVQDDATSAWFAVVLSRPGQAPRLTASLRRVPDVSEVGGMGRLFPADLEDRDAAIAALRDGVNAPPTPDTARGLGPMLQELRTVQQGIVAASLLAPGAIKEELTAVKDRIGAALAAAAGLDAQGRAAAWERLNSSFVTARGELATWLSEALSPAPMSADDLPPLLRDQWVGRDGSWLLQVHPGADPQGRSILDPDRLGPFVTAVQSALAGTGATVIGPPVQIYRSSELIKREYIKAAALALAAILILLFLDFRSLADALCAMMPVGVGFIGAFGLMGAFNVPLNFANIIVLPIIFGIGVSAGVNVVHRWRAEPFGRPRGLSGATGRGITLTNTTTIIGFGSLLIAQHRGIRSLGFVMVIGLGMTVLACYTMLPALLRLRTHVEPPAAGVARRAARAPGTSAASGSSLAPATPAAGPARRARPANG